MATMTVAAAQLHPYAPGPASVPRWRPPRAPGTERRIEPDTDPTWFDLWSTTSALPPMTRPVISAVEAYRVAVTAPWRDDEPAVSHKIERRVPAWGGLPVVYATNDEPLLRPTGGYPTYDVYSPTWGTIPNDVRKADAQAVGAPHTRRNMVVPKDCAGPMRGDTPHVYARRWKPCTYPLTRCE